MKPAVLIRRAVLLILTVATTAGTAAAAAADAAQPAAPAVAVRVADDYAFGGFRGPFTSPPSADGNPRRAVIVSWRDFPYRFVFAHEASYCPWIEFPATGAAACFQFCEGNDGHAELFNQFGRQENNSFVEIVAQRPDRVHIRWTYFGVNKDSGERFYHATEDFFARADGQVVRKQTFKSLRPGHHHAYAREPIELIGLAPVGRTWRDVLRPAAAPATDGAGEYHALAALDPFSEKRYDVYWTPKPGTLVGSTARRAGGPWKALDDAAGIVLALPLRGATPFVAFGTASGFDARTTRIKEHSFPDTGGHGWGSTSWDHWPIGWLNSQAHEVDAATTDKYPNHFAPAGMDLFALPNEQVEQGVYWSLIGVAGEDVEAARGVAREWLESAPMKRDTP